MEEIKKQRYVVKASQQDCYYFYPFTTDKKMIEKNIDHARRDCFIADFGRISGVIVQDSTDFKTIGDFVIYEGDGVLFQNDEFYEMCEVVKKKGKFYGSYQDENDETQYVLMTEEFKYEFEKEDEYDNYDDDEMDCGCCPCCGCTCDFGEDE